MEPPPLSSDYGPGNVERAPADPFAVALANASLLGVGYLLLGRRWFAFGTTSLTLVLVVAIASIEQPTWVQAALLAWWIAMIVHGWRLAGGRLRRTHSDTRPPGASRQRLIALGVVVVMLGAVGLLRFDASRIETNAAVAHRTNQCPQAISGLNELWLGHRIVDPALVARAKDSLAACDLLIDAKQQASKEDRLAAARTLRTYSAHPAALWKGADDRRADLLLAQASDELDGALDGDTAAMGRAFGHLGTVLDEAPGRGQEVSSVVDEFVQKLPDTAVCVTKDLTDWLRGRPDGGKALEQARAAVPQIAPAAILGCGDQLRKESAFEEARKQYEQLLEQYPDHKLRSDAKKGVVLATQAIELRQVRGLLETTYGESTPAYCKNPAPYSGADPYRGRGPHPAMFFGNNNSKKKLPSKWLTDDAAKAVLVICAGKTKHGSTDESCPYESSALRIGPTWVAFKNRKVHVRVYEVRTGKVVADRNVEIGGDSCPPVVHYTYYGNFDTGPPSTMYVKSTKSDYREAYESLIKP